jgi:hypothetical protein
MQTAWTPILFSMSALFAAQKKKHNFANDFGISSAPLQSKYVQWWCAESRCDERGKPTARGNIQEPVGAK